MRHIVAESTLDPVAISRHNREGRAACRNTVMGRIGSQEGPGDGLTIDARSTSAWVPVHFLAACASCMLTRTGNPAKCEMGYQA